MQKKTVITSSRHLKELEEERLRNSVSSSRKNQTEESEESDESDEEEEEEDEPPVKKSRAAARPSPKVYVRPSPSSTKSKTTPKSIRATPTTTSQRMKRSKQNSEDEVSEEEKPMRSRQARGRSTKEMIADASSEDEKAMDVEPDDGISAASDEESANSQLGTKVEAKFQSKWSNGTITQVNKKKGKWKVKFDKYPQDKYDSWFDFDSSEVRILKNNQVPAAESTVGGAPGSPGGSVSSQEAANEAPSSSTATTAGANNQYAEDIANGYRTCLRYFLPPQWMMDKDAVSGLSTQELANFPLDDFFDHYEKGLRKLVSSFQMEAQQKQSEAESARTKLSSVRKLIAKLLKSINEEFDIDPEADTDQVDDLLAACVKQALQQQS